ncbi:hypothetical protein [Pseudomonas atacamensis]|uniref:hypothetical protein n=1 Tax=Pseudomonas atacamensis TaxID=2565368 RepID=UPI0019CFDEC5|nr:hypothetical protein [Pseudomonas atacamensis]QSL90472.1 hypothetical protein JWU58_26910 [Pseudomonas atacamensis]
MLIDDVMTDRITLHGLGFVQVQLQGNQRLHVWHPELPRRACFAHSAIHDHRFNFTSRVIVGTQLNHCFRMERCEEGAYMLYLHEGARTACGGRPWTPDGRANLVLDGQFKVEAGNDYNTIAYEYHGTTPGGDGRVATIMAKRGEYPAGAHSTCTYGVQPDTEFDRYQWSPAQLWEVVSDVLLGVKVPR